MILGIGWVRDFVPQIDWELLSLTLPLSDGTSITIAADWDIPAGSGVPCITAIIPIDPPVQQPYVIPQLRTSQALVPQGHSTLSVVDTGGQAVRPRLGTLPRSPSPRASVQDRRLAFPHRHRLFDSRLTRDKVCVSGLALFQGYPPSQVPTTSVPGRHSRSRSRSSVPALPPWQFPSERLATHREDRRFGSSTSV